MKIPDALAPLLSGIRTRSLVREIDAESLLLDRAFSIAPSEPNLYTIELGPGDHGSINVGWFSNGAEKLDPQTWLDQGFDGVRFVGAGVDVTHVRCTSWDGITLAVGRHNGVVQFENMTVHAGHEKGAHFGEQNYGKVIAPRFQVRLLNVKGVVDSPESYRDRRAVKAGDAAPYTGTLVAAGKPDVQIAKKGDEIPHAGMLVGLPRRPKWFWFSYNCDLYMRKVRTYAADLVEHSLYAHGFARFGLDIDECEFDGSGSQQVKVRSDASETGWAGPEQAIKIRRTHFRDNMRVWSWRGPGMIVIEGGASSVFIERCFFWGGTPSPGVQIGDRSRAIAISCEGNSYAHRTGEIGTGFGNGWVVIRECAAFGAADNFWHNEIIRCGRNGGTQQSARGFLLERSGVYGRNVQVQLGAIPAGRAVIRGCNTPQIAEILRGMGMETSPEAVIATASRLVPIGEGFVR